MDERTEMCSEYSKAARKEMEPMVYLVATTNRVAGKSIPELSVRELVVFVPGIEL